MNILAQMRLTDLILDPRCQMRVAFSEEYARGLADYLEMGGSLPALDSFRAPELRRGPSLLADGWHRRRARELLGQKYVEVKIHPGGLREAILFATNCNARSPMRPAAEDFRKAVATLLLDPEWGQWSARTIAIHCGVSRSFVDRLKDRLSELSGAESQIDQNSVQVSRGGTTYVMRFRDMTPAQQQRAVEDETADHRAAWLREGTEALETTERHFANLGDPYGPVLGHASDGLRTLRQIEKARLAAGKARPE